MSNFVVPRRSLMLGSAALALAPAVAFATTSPDLGKAAPAFSAVDSNGKTWSLADLKGKVVVLETTNHDCPYVRKHYNAKNMQTQQREAAAKGVVWLTTASNATGEQGHVTAAQANDLTKSRDAAPAAVLLDPQSKIARAYGATVTPHMYIIDASGMLVYKGGIDSIPSSSVGDIPKATQYVRVALDQVLAGKPVTEASTRAYGCTLKYPQHLDLIVPPCRTTAGIRTTTTMGMHHRPRPAADTAGSVLAAATFLPFGGASAQTSMPPRASPTPPPVSSLPSTTASAARR